MTDSDGLYTRVSAILDGLNDAHLASLLKAATAERLERVAHGDNARWMAAVDALPELQGDRVALDAPSVSVATEPPADAPSQARIRECLLALHPWRKGPFSIHGVAIDSEWRSNWKWDRLVDAITPLDGRTVLDVGCGNGYYGWRMLGTGATRVIGMDPSYLYTAQFLAVSHFIHGHRLAVVPLTLEDLPEGIDGFDTVFSMGVLYHRRGPLEHLMALKQRLRPGGELVLETLVVDGGPDTVLVPPGRYAGMRNLWFIPSPAALLVWLERCGFASARVVDVTTTTTAEQRSTSWMRFESLTDRLDPQDPGRTVEGHPAPTRAIVVAST